MKGKGCVILGVYLSPLLLKSQYSLKKLFQDISKLTMGQSRLKFILSLSSHEINFIIRPKISSENDFLLSCLSFFLQKKKRIKNLAALNRRRRNPRRQSRKSNQMRQIRIKLQDVSTGCPRYTRCSNYGVRITQPRIKRPV